MRTGERREEQQGLPEDEKHHGDDLHKAVADLSSWNFHESPSQAPMEALLCDKCLCQQWLLLLVLKGKARRGESSVGDGGESVFTKERELMWTHDAML